MQRDHIPRTLGQSLGKYLAVFPVVAVLGPRQVGKTTLARDIAESSVARRSGKRGLYLDLENPRHLARLSDPGSYLRRAEDRLVVLDEVHRVPQLFGTLRGVVDDLIRKGTPAGQFMVLGSASIDLMRQSGETLAGRIGYLELGPLDVREVPSADARTLWVRGGFPRSFLATSDTASALWRENFIRTYLERDVPMLGPRIPAETLRRFWTMVAHLHGQLWNASMLARSLGVDGKTVARYLDLLVDLLLVRRLPPLHVNTKKRLVKSPKIYIRDSGIVHTLLGLDDEDAVLGHPVAGASWEGLVIETLLRAAPERAHASFFRTATGVEIDLVLDLPGGERWAIEVKRGRPTVTRGTRTAIADLNPDRTFVVYDGEEAFSLGSGVEAIGLHDLAGALAGI